MATPSAARLVLLPFLQQWNGNDLKLRVVCIPKTPPLEPLVAGSGPSFASVKLTLDVHVLPPDNLPGPDGAVVATLEAPSPSSAELIFKQLAQDLSIDPNPPRARRPAGSKVNKFLPRSYRDAVAYVPGSNPLLKTGSEYQCSRVQRLPATEKPPKINLAESISWGRIVAQLLKNPVLGKAAGLVRDIQVPISDPRQVRDGGFLFVALASSSEGAGLLQNGEDVKVYATQFPPLRAGQALALFSPCLLPLATTPSSVDYSKIFAEILDYNDGFAKAVHCSQQQALDPVDGDDPPSDRPVRPVKETGIRLGWDDEQVTVWLNRQWDATEPAYDAPLGTAGYRIDGREEGETSWRSLVTAAGDFKIGQVDLGPQTTELSISVQPAQLDAKIEGTYWLPSYYDAWTGPAMGTQDELQSQLLALPTSPNIFKGVAPGMSLRYGRTYEFRVRLMDTSGGGPNSLDDFRNPGPSRTASITFHRYIQPGPPLVTRGANSGSETDPQSPPTILSFKRPLLAYPAIACASQIDVRQGLLDDIEPARIARREPGLPDPDVDRVQILLQVFTFPQDPDADGTGFRTVYTTYKQFPADAAEELSVELDWVDVPNVDDLAEDTDGDRLKLPSGRDVRLQVSSFCKDDDGPIKYFGADDVRTSSHVYVKLRKHPASEPQFFRGASLSDQFSAYFLRPTRNDQVPRPPDAMERLAAALNLPLVDNTFRAQAGSRVVFGCAKSIPHQVGPDGASLTMSTKAAVSNRWLVIIRLVVNRDWSWDGFSQIAFNVERDGNAVGAINKTNALGREATAISASAAIRAARTHTEFLFVDSINPQPAAGEHPEELMPRYRVRPNFVQGATFVAPLDFEIRLPITTPPAQVPKIVSAGIAMSPYTRSDDYSRTEHRQKRLWVEFEAPPANPRDAYFARVLRNVPDLLIFPDRDTPELESLPVLPIDPEEIRHIINGQPADYAGLGAMVQLTPSDDSDRHFLLPLPCDDDSPKLFGLWAYEFRLGHAKPDDPAESVWSTAQGRFGAPLVVNGLQHPPPALVCQAYRTRKGIAATATYAQAVRDGSSIGSSLVGDREPSRGVFGQSVTTMWFLVYAQAKQLDDKGYRNILVARQIDDALVSATSPMVSAPVVRRPSHAHTTFGEDRLQIRLKAYGFKSAARLSVLAVEMMPSFRQNLGFPDPLGGDLGQQRILRTSALVPVQTLCGT